MNRKIKSKMRIVIYSLLLALVFFGCRSVKERKSLAVSDSSARQSVVLDSNIVTRNIEIRDTSIVIPFARVSGTVTLSDLLPNYTAQGKPVAKKIEQHQGNLKSYITVKADSSIEYGAELDSLVITVKNLYREISVLKSVQKTAEVNYTARKSERMEWREIKPLVSLYGPWFILGLLIILLLPKSKK